MALKMSQVFEFESQHMLSWYAPNLGMNDFCRLAESWTAEPP
jgi:hypothetical protein